MFEELSARLHVVKDGFPSITAAQEWIESDVGNATILAVIAKYPPK
jgi:hypothetical protein